VCAPLPEELATDAKPSIDGDDIGALTRSLATGDDDAFREFHRRYFDRLYRLLLILTRGQETEAREALQDVLCRVARRARRFDRKEVFWCWLVMLARSAVLDAGRKRHRYWRLLTDYARRWLPVQSQPVPDQDHQLETLLLACVNELDPAERALVEGKYFSRCSTLELARQNGLTPRAVESRLFRLRNRLHQELLQRLRQDPP
jgi:RNA polymerase sigma-70 factor (ECF subfamily)